jgi:hypothetical protein
MMSRIDRAAVAAAARRPHPATVAAAVAVLLDEVAVYASGGTPPHDPAAHAIIDAHATARGIDLTDPDVVARLAADVYARIVDA